MPKYTVSDVYEITQENLKRIRSNATEWADFLKRSAYFFKYSFAEQIVITSMKPEARAVADFDTWSKKLNAHINDGAKGIPLIKSENGNQVVKYVFDISDTNSRYKLWQMPTNDSKFTEQLAVSVDKQEHINKGLTDILESMAYDETRLIFNENNLGEYRKLGIGDIDNFFYCSLLVSVYSRCGIPIGSYVGSNANFKTLSSLSDSQLLSIGNSLNNAVKRILTNIEKNTFLFLQASRNSAQIEQKNVTVSEAEVRRETPVTPTENRIIGNTPYKYIPKKTYRKLAAELALKVSESIENANISYSGRRNNNDTITLTVSEADIDKVDSFIADVKNSMPRQSFTAEEIEIAKQTNLVNFLSARGEKVKRVGSNEYTLQSHDSMRLSDNKFFWNSRGVSGNAVSYCMEYYGMDFKAAVAELLNYNGYSVNIGSNSVSYTPPSDVEQASHPVQAAESEEDEHKPLPYDLDSKTNRVYAYLTKSRGLDGKLVRRFIDEGIIAQDIKGNAVFKVLDENGELSGAEISGTLTDKRYKQVTERSGNGFTINPTSGNPEKVIFFEAAIDTLSYYNLHPETKALLVSMAGLKDKVVLTTLQRYGIDYSNATIATDNDEAGRAFAEKMHTQYGMAVHQVNAPEYTEYQTNNIKDWNDLLQAVNDSKKNSAQLEQNNSEADKNIIGNTPYRYVPKKAYRKLATELALKVADELNEAGIKFSGKINSNVTTLTLDGNKIKECEDIISNVKAAFDKPAETEQQKEKSFAEQVDEVLNGTANRYNDLKVCDTPQILLDVGCKQLPMFYTKKHLRDALKPKGYTGESIHYHGLDKEQIKKIPDLLADPVMVYDSLSSSRNDSLVVVTSELDKDNLPIIAVIRPNGKAKYDLEIVNSNFVLSVHGREHFDNQLIRAFNENKFLYVNKNKSQVLFSVLGLQLSEGFNNLGFDTIIHQSHNIVNPQQSENSQSLATANAVSETQQVGTSEPNAAIHLYKLGAFYEAYNNEAVIVANSLGLTLTSKVIDGIKAPMVGFPQHVLNDYIQKLSDNGYTVEVANETEVQSTEKYNADNISAAFDILRENHPFWGEALDILKLTEEYMLNNNVSEFKFDILRLPIFESYGSLSKINERYFENSLREVMAELNANIKPITNVSIQALLTSYSEHYERISNWSLDDPQIQNAISVGDNFIETHPELMYDFIELHQDYISSDREVAAFAYALADNDVIDKDDVYTILPLEVESENLAERAELLGAIRLPNTAFKANAGTEVTSDIIFLQKREMPVELTSEAMPEWVGLAKNENGIELNAYFANHPEMILGEMKEVSGRFGIETTCELSADKSLSQLLDNAISNISGSIEENYAQAQQDLSDTSQLGIIPENYRNYCYAVIGDDIYYREGSEMLKQELNKDKKARLTDMIGISKVLQELIECQTNDRPEEQIRACQGKLNTLYDSFTQKYGLLSDNKNKSIFRLDDTVALLLSLENIDDKGKLINKADIFTKRTIQPYKPVTSVNTASEALAVSISEKAGVDLKYMSDLCSKSREDITNDLKGVIFKNPITEKYETAEEYLSGNVRDKLRIAREKAEKDSNYMENVTALGQVQPEDLKPEEISVQLGSTWVPVKYFEQFMYELLDTPDRCRSTGFSNFSDPFASSGYYADNQTITVAYDEYTATYGISNKSSYSADKGNVRASQTYGTDRMNAYTIIENTLNGKPVRIVDYYEDAEGRKKSVLNEKETLLAQDKQNTIKQKFREWIFADAERTEDICRIYNDKFNSIRPREYDGSHITFGGINPEIRLKKHQTDAIAHTLYGGNTLLAHSVGAGKTFEMVASAMESKRLGLCTKSLICVPKAIVGQTAREFLQLYPTANILVPDEKDFSKDNRQRFCSRIATGNYDAVIISHNQLEKIPLSAERQITFIENEITEITVALEQLKADKEGRGFTVKQLEATKKSLQTKLEKLNNSSNKDSVITFEELGVDKLYVDEAHMFKNLYFNSKIGRNVAGINTSSISQRATDLFMKCRYLDEKTCSRGVVFATGTPAATP